LPAALGADLSRLLAERPTGRLRITVRPRGGPLQATLTVTATDDAAPVTDLVPVVVPGGIGQHKWADRRLLGQLTQTAEATQPAQLLIEDDDGTALETDRANVFAVTGSVLTTPPADGRLLPGITRARVLRLAATVGLAAEVTPLTRQDLLTAQEVFVTNSVRGIVPVRSVAGVTLPAVPGAATVRLAAALAADNGGVVDNGGVDNGGGADEAGRAAADVRCPSACANGTDPSVIARGNVQRFTPPLRPPADAAPLVAVIDNYDSFTFNLVHYLITAGCAVEVVRNDEVTASQVLALGPAGIVISPGPGTPHDAGISIDVVRAAAAAVVPVLGVCLGHQAIAACFGASIVRAAPVHGQLSIVKHDGLGVLAGLPQQFEAVRYHSLIVAEQTLPPSLKITARTRDGIPMALRHDSLPIDGVQFHPESVLTSHGHAIIGNFASSLPALSRIERHR
jgi:para-aminobenzoate synthetase/4-amino-4-deoxychorismate lyase